MTAKTLKDGTTQKSRLRTCAKCGRQTVHLTVVGSDGEKFKPGWECNDCGTVTPRKA